MVGGCGAVYFNRINGQMEEGGGIQGQVIMDLGVRCPNGVTKLELAIPYTGTRE